MSYYSLKVPTCLQIHVSDYVAKFAFEGNSVNDLNFWPGDVIKVLWAEDSGWWHGQLGNKQGWFPGSYVEVMCKYCTPVCCSYGSGLGI